MQLILLLAASLSCPVLSTASVAGAFGEMQADVTKTDKGVTCVFARAEYRLSVEVSELAAGKFADFVKTNCKGSRDVVTLKAIGNEAAACSLGTGGKVTEKVVGRVRNQAFVFFLNSTDQAADAGTVRTKIVALSEQVAGNLF